MTAATEARDEASETSAAQSSPAPTAPQAGTPAADLHPSGVPGATSPVPGTPAVTPESSKDATFEDLMGKKRRRSRVPILTYDDEGHAHELVVRLEAISSAEYDELVAKSPPTVEQRGRGAEYNVDTFAPALISACSLKPKLDVSQATAIYRNKDWTAGEVGGLFLEALRICNAGLAVPFTENA